MLNKILKTLIKKKSHFRVIKLIGRAIARGLKEIAHIFFNKLDFCSFFLHTSISLSSIHVYIDRR